MNQLGRVFRSSVALSVARTDDMRWVTIVGVVGFAIAIAMATFGLPPVDLHGPLHRMGIMDPLCGGTRAARLTAQGDLGAAWRYNPLGIVTTLAAALAAARLLLGLMTRRWVNVSVLWTPRTRRMALVVGLALLVALEVRQQGRADLLLRPY